MYEFENTSAKDQALAYWRDMAETPREYRKRNREVKRYQKAEQKYIDKMVKRQRVLNSIFMTHKIQSTMPVVMPPIYNGRQ